MLNWKLRVLILRSLGQLFEIIIPIYCFQTILYQHSKLQGINYHKNSINLNNFEKLLHYHGFHLCEISGIGSAINHNLTTITTEKICVVWLSKWTNQIGFIIQISAWSKGNDIKHLKHLIFSIVFWFISNFSILLWS